MSLCVVFHWTEPALIKSSWKDLQTLQGRPRVLINCLCRGYEDRVEDIEWNTNVDNSWKAILWLKQQHFPIGQPNQLSWQQSITISYVTSCKTFWEFLNTSKRRNSPSFHPSLDIFRSININLWTIFHLHCSVAVLQYWTLGEHGGT